MLFEIKSHLEFCPSKLCRNWDHNVQDFFTQIRDYFTQIRDFVTVVSDDDVRGYVVRNYVYGILSLYTIHLQCIKNNFSVQVAPSRAGHTRQLLRQSDNRFEAKTNVSSPITTKYCV